MKVKFVLIFCFASLLLNPVNTLAANPVYISFNSNTLHHSVLIKASIVGSSVTIPLKRAGKLMMLDAVIDSVEGNLILDTGAMGIVLNSVYFRGDRRAGGITSGGITGKVHQVEKARIQAVVLPELRFEDVQVDITDLSHLEQVRNVKILGFFGLGLLRDYELAIDLRAGYMELHDLDLVGSHTKSKTTHRFDFQVPVYNESGVLFVQAKINQKKLRFCVDTGAEKNVLNSYLNDKILNTVTVVSRSKLSGSGKLQMEVYHGIMNDFSLGGVQMTGMQTIITNLTHMSEAYGVVIDGMLGCDFFERGIVVINLKKRMLSMSIHKNT